MQLPGKLSLSTLGDLLGALHRGRTSGVLVLRETRGLSAGRRHHIHLRS
ncbi:MAG: molecular chaperone DnaJ, partial [Myxococcales bacterium]